jgi:hypothetical protein
MTINEKIYWLDVAAAGDQIRIEGVGCGSARYIKICDVYHVGVVDVEGYILDTECSYSRWLDEVI